jgi:hypothetical protein
MRAFAFGGLLIRCDLGRKAQKKKCLGIHFEFTPTRPYWYLFGTLLGQHAKPLEQFGISMG